MATNESMKPEEFPRGTQPAPGYRDLHRALKAARNATWWRVFRVGGMRAIGTIGATFALGVLAVMMWPTSWAGAVAATLLAVAILAALAVLFARPLLRVPGIAHYTRRIDERYGGERNEFLSAFELGGAPARTGTSSGLIQALVNERVEATRRLDLDAPGREPLGRRWAVLPAIAAAAIVVPMVTAPGRYSSAVHELTHAQLPISTPIAIEVLTGNVRVEQGADVVVQARVTGHTQAEPTLEARRGAGVWRQFSAERDETAAGGTAAHASTGTAAKAANTYRFTVPHIESETHYRVMAAGVSSPEYLIRVLEPLRVSSFRFEYRYPDYSRLKTETLQASDGSVAALRGTEVTVTFEANQPLKWGGIEFGTGNTGKVQIVGSTRARTSFPIVNETTYTLVLEREGRGNDARATAVRLGPYRITPSPDREPLVAVLRPGEDTDLPADMRVPLTVHAADDYGLASLHLSYTPEGGEPKRQRLVRFTGYPREATETYVWDLSGLKLIPGDLVTYYVEVYDNDTVSGPKSARSTTYTLRVPTLTDLYTEAEETHRETKVSLEQVREEGLELKQELERISREMSKFPDSKWEDKQEVAQAFERQQEMREKLEKLADSLGESLQKMDNRNLVDEEVLEKVLEIQKLMEQISDPDLQKAFERLREQLSQLDQNEVQKALRDLALTHDELMKNLEKTIEMLRQVELEEKLERAVKEAEELVARQDEINEGLEHLEKKDPESGNKEDQSGEEKDGKKGESKESESKEGEGKEGEKENKENQDGKSDSADDSESKEGENEDSSSKDEELSRLSEEEEEGMKDAEELAKLLEELSKQLAAMNEQVSKELERLSEQSEQGSPMQSNMQSAMQEMARANSKGAKKSGQKASQNMRSLLEQLRMQQEMMMNDETAELAEKLRAAAHELLKVSNEEEELIGLDEEARGEEMATEDAAGAQRMAEDQFRLLEATQRVNKLVEEIARTSVMVGTDFAGILGLPMRSMQNATSSYERGNVSGGRMHSYQALAQVNEAILKLLGKEQEMCQAGGGSCSSMKKSMQQMSELSQSQQQVNEGTRQLMQQGGQRLSEGGQQRLARLAAQQAAIQQGLSEVAQGLDGRREVLGDLGDLAEEMQEATKDMEQSKLDDRLLSRQHQILGRLLDAQRSVRKRDLGRERLSRTGEQGLGQESLPALPEELLSRRDRLEADILRGRSDPYPPGFRELVDRYFRALVKAPADDQTPN